MSSMPPPPNQQQPPPPPAGGQPAASQTVRPGYQQYPAQTQYAGPPGYAMPRRQRTGWLLFAQILTTIEAILGMLLGVGVILLGIVGTTIINNAHIPNVSARIAGAATGILIGAGVIVLLFFLALLICGIMAGRPSLGARITVGILVIILVLLSLAGIQQNFSTTSGTISLIVFWAWNAIILFGMLIHGTRSRTVVAR